MAKNEINAIVVDDEPLACKRLVKLLNKAEAINVAAVCENGMIAIKKINKLKPDLVFLDIQMPEVDGFEVLKNIETDPFPAIIFVTAYDEYAVRAFEVHVVDYLMKPFDNQRFNDALDQARGILARQATHAIEDKVNDLIHTVHKEQDPVSRLLIKSSGRYFFVKVEDVDWIESAGNYVRIHTNGKNYLIRDTMLNMESKLDSDIFFRIHRSAIVNVDKVKELEQWFHGDYKVTLESGEELTLSRNYKDLLQRF